MSDRICPTVRRRSGRRSCSPGALTAGATLDRRSQSTAETIVLDVGGQPAVAVIEALLYRSLLNDDDAGRSLFSRHLANHVV